jgi:hypothetical protein
MIKILIVARAPKFRPCARLGGVGAARGSIGCGRLSGWAAPPAGLGTRDAGPSVHQAVPGTGRSLATAARGPRGSVPQPLPPWRAPLRPGRRRPRDQTQPRSCRAHLDGEANLWAGGRETVALIVGSFKARNQGGWWRRFQLHIIAGRKERARP